MQIKFQIKHGIKLPIKLRFPTNNKENSPKILEIPINAVYESSQK